MGLSFTLIVDLPCLSLYRGGEVVTSIEIGLCFVKSELLPDDWCPNDWWVIIKKHQETWKENRTTDLIKNLSREMHTVKVLRFIFFSREVVASPSLI